MGSETVRVLGLVTARGGSKGIPGKNLVLLGGRPLITYTLTAALDANCLSAVIVSTDSPEIADVARAAGARVPFLRPAALSGDAAGQIDVVLHALAELERSGESYDAVALLQPTSPLRRAADIDAAVSLLEASGADSVISLAPAGSHHPCYGYRLEDGWAQPIFPVSPGTRRQDLPDLYLRNGAVYVTRRNVLLENHDLYGRRTAGYVMPAERSVNIDTPHDLAFAEFLIARGRS
jgi:CMP-N-acetylneuraminic acid synthetase